MWLSCPRDQQREVPRVQSRYQPSPAPGHTAFSRCGVFLRIGAGLKHSSSFQHFIIVSVVCCDHWAVAGLVFLFEALLIMMMLRKDPYSLMLRPKCPHHHRFIISCNVSKPPQSPAPLLSVTSALGGLRPRPPIPAPAHNTILGYSTSGSLFMETTSWLFVLSARHVGRVWRC